jgi:hypothetical protein
MTAYQFTRRPAQAFEIYGCGLPLIGPDDWQRVPEDAEELTLSRLNQAL